MKTLVTLLLLTLICFLCHNSAAPVQGPGMLVGECCPNCTRIVIPKARVKRVAMTPSYCSSKAIVVTTACGKKLCRDPNWTWAKNLLKEYEMSLANRTSSSDVPKPSNC